MNVKMPAMEAVMERGESVRVDMGREGFDEEGNMLYRSELDETMAAWCFFRINITHDINV